MNFSKAGQPMPRLRFAISPWTRIRAAALVIAASAILCLPGCAPGGSGTPPPPGPTPTEIVVTPSVQYIPIGLTQQFTATGHYSDGTTKDITQSVTWSSSDTAVATISNSAGSIGLATGVAAGSTMIQATNGIVQGRAAFNVNQPITLITVAPGSSTVATGVPLQFTATATYGDNSTGDLTSAVTWSSSDPTKATISNFAAYNGLVTPLAPGSTTIQAAFEGTSGSTNLTVGAPVQVGLLVSPQTPSFADAGATQQLSALAQFSDGSMQDVTGTASWSSNNSGLASVAPGGLVTSGTLPAGQTAGFASIQAAITAGSSTFTGVAVLSVTLHTGNGYAGTLTQHNDIARTGQNTNESVLTTANVNSTSFGKLFSQSVDGMLFAQPLYVPNVSIGGAVHNVIYVATEGDSVYAFDADSNTGANATPLWHASLIDTAHGAAAGATTVVASSGGQNIDVACGNIPNQLGITATPVIDPSTNTMYVAVESKENGVFYQRLHAIDITTGAEKSQGPVAIAGTVPGTADGSNIVTFDPLQHLSRPGLLLMNGTVYIAYSSNCDNIPYHGWVFAYDARTFTQKGIFATTPDGGLGGIWMTGCGLAADSNGNVYLASGNGDFDVYDVPAMELGDTLLKLNLRGNFLTVADYFTPFDQNSLDDGDVDLGSGGLVLLPDQTGTYPHLLVQAGKEGTVYLVNRDQLTANNQHYCSNCTSDPQVVQELPQVISGGMWSMPAYWNGNVYFWGSGDSLSAFGISAGTLTNLPTSTSSLSLTYPGSVPSVSSSGTTNGIVWSIDATQYSETAPKGQAVLHAYDATNLRTELYNSTMALGNRDEAGTGVKFSTPTVANGKVYIGTQTELDVYGLLP
jgi:hypothetical protein